MNPAASPKPGRGRIWLLLTLAALLCAALVGAIVRFGMAPAAAPTPAPAATSFSASSAAPATAAPHGAKAGVQAAKPLWAELTPDLQKALAPLAPEWDQFSLVRKKKWLAIGNKFATMSPAEQQRVHQRMTEWMQLTPQQRRVARDSYSRAKKLEPKQKSERWEQYQQLPDEQKEKLANTAIDKRIATLPPASSRNKAVAPIKTTPKPELEQALTPQAGVHPAVPPPAPPAALPSTAPPPAAAPPPEPAAPAAAAAVPAPDNPTAGDAPAPAPAPLDPTQF